MTDLAPVRSKALLMAAGLGTRLRPVTLHTPKCLVPIAGRPLLDYWFDRLAAAHIDEVLVNTHHLVDPMRDYLRSVDAQGRAGQRFRVRESHEPVLLGSAGTVHANRAYADDADHVLIVYADNLSGMDLAAMMQAHVAHGQPVTMALFRTEVPERCGIAEVDAAMRVTAFVEKPAHPQSNLANAGVYCVRAEAFREMADMNAFDLGFDVLPRFVGRMVGWEWTGYHLDVGTLDALKQAEADVASGCLRPGYQRVVHWPAASLPS